MGRPPAILPSSVSCRPTSRSTTCRRAEKSTTRYAGGSAATSVSSFLPFALLRHGGRRDFDLCQGRNWCRRARARAHRDPLPPPLPCPLAGPQQHPGPHTLERQHRREALPRGACAGGGRGSSCGLPNGGSSGSAAGPRRALPGAAGSLPARSAGRRAAEPLGGATLQAASFAALQHLTSPTVLSLLNRRAAWATRWWRRSTAPACSRAWSKLEEQHSRLTPAVAVAASKDAGSWLPRLPRLPWCRQQGRRERPPPQAPTPTRPPRCSLVPAPPSAPTRPPTTPLTDCTARTCSKLPSLLSPPTAGPAGLCTPLAWAAHTLLSRILHHQHPLAYTQPPLTDCLPRQRNPRLSNRHCNPPLPTSLPPLLLSAVRCDMRAGAAGCKRRRSFTLAVCRSGGWDVQTQKHTMATRNHEGGRGGGGGRSRGTRGRAAGWAQGLTPKRVGCMGGGSQAARCGKRRRHSRSAVACRPARSGAA